jgi:hypothetical protein
MMFFQNALQGEEKEVCNPNCKIDPATLIPLQIALILKILLNVHVTNYDHLSSCSVEGRICPYP